MAEPAARPHLEHARLRTMFVVLPVFAIPLVYVIASYFAWVGNPILATLFFLQAVFVRLALFQVEAGEPQHRRWLSASLFVLVAGGIPAAICLSYGAFAIEWMLGVLLLGLQSWVLMEPLRLHPVWASQPPDHETPRLAASPVRDEVIETAARSGVRLADVRVQPDITRARAEIGGERGPILLLSSGACEMENADVRSAIVTLACRRWQLASPWWALAGVVLLGALLHQLYWRMWFLSPLGVLAVVSLVALYVRPWLDWLLDAALIFACRRSGCGPHALSSALAREAADFPGSSVGTSHWSARARKRLWIEWLNLRAGHPRTLSWPTRLVLPVSLALPPIALAIWLPAVIDQRALGAFLGACLLFAPLVLYLAGRNTRTSDIDPLAFLIIAPPTWGAFLYPLWRLSNMSTAGKPSLTFWLPIIVLFAAAAASRVFLQLARRIQDQE